MFEQNKFWIAAFTKVSWLSNGFPKEDREDMGRRNSEMVWKPTVRGTVKIPHCGILLRQAHRKKIIVYDNSIFVKDLIFLRWVGCFFFMLWGFHLGRGGGNGTFLLPLLYNSLKSLKHSLHSLSGRNPVETCHDSGYARLFNNRCILCSLPNRSCCGRVARRYLLPILFLYWRKCIELRWRVF